MAIAGGGKDGGSLLAQHAHAVFFETIYMIESKFRH